MTQKDVKFIEKRCIIHRKQWKGDSLKPKWRVVRLDHLWKTTNWIGLSMTVNSRQNINETLVVLLPCFLSRACKNEFSLLFNWKVCIWRLLCQVHYSSLFFLQPPPLLPLPDPLALPRVLSCLLPLLDDWIQMNLQFGFGILEFYSKLGLESQRWGPVISLLHMRFFNWIISVLSLSTIPNSFTLCGRCVTKRCT